MKKAGGAVPQERSERLSRARFERGQGKSRKEVGDAQAEHAECSHQGQTTSYCGGGG